MGLDNGIIVQKKNEDKYFEIMYYRKRWDIREEILDALGVSYLTDEYEFRLDKFDIQNIRDILVDKVWSEFEDPEIDWMVEIHIKHLKKLNKLLDIMDNYKLADDIEIVFYDSY